MVLPLILSYYSHIRIQFSRIIEVERSPSDAAIVLFVGARMRKLCPCPDSGRKNDWPAIYPDVSPFGPRV